MTYTPEQLREEAFREFEQWFIANYPGPETIISDPAWHAPKIFRSATHRQDKAHAAALERLAERDAENAVLRDAINDALPWMIKLGDYIGNGTQADPMGRCNAILKMRIAVEKRDD